jgi:hypothetical protein
MLWPQYNVRVILTMTELSGDAQYAGVPLD